MNERNSDNWEKGFDLNALPDVEEVDATETAPVSVESPPTLEEPVLEVTTEPAAPELDDAAPSDADDLSADHEETVTEPEQMPVREIDPRSDPLAGWVSGHPLAEGQSRPTMVEDPASVPAFAIVAAGEDPFAGRFGAPAEEAPQQEVVEEAGVAESAEPAEAVAESTGAEEPMEYAASAEMAVASASAAYGHSAAAAQVPDSMVQGALQARKASTEPAIDVPEERPQLAEVVPISGRTVATKDAGGSGDDAAEASAMRAFLAGLSDEELDRAVELFEQQVKGGSTGEVDDEDFPADVLDPFSEVLSSTFGEVELLYRIEEIEDIIDARLPDAARRDSEWWSNRAGKSDLGHARAWVTSGWWSYPDLDAGRVRFRRPV